MKFSDFQKKLSEGFGNAVPPEHQKAITEFSKKLSKMTKASFGSNDEYPEDSAQIYVELLIQEVTKYVLNPAGQDITCKFRKK